jgi:hypothetical protein
MSGAIRSGYRAQLGTSYAQELHVTAASSECGPMKPWLLEVRLLSIDLVHHLCALGERGPDLVTVDRLRGGRAIVTD